MKIILDSPYKDLYKHAYLRTSKDGRQRLDLVNSDSDRTTIAYAKYLLTVKHNRLLTSNEEADHIDEDCTNDCIDNLQILTKEEHAAKTLLRTKTGRTTKTHICKHCGKEFVREARFKTHSYCSRSCNGKASGFASMRRIPVPTEHLEQIKHYRLDGLSDYKIAELLPYNRSKIFNLRKENHIK